MQYLTNSISIHYLLYPMLCKMSNVKTQGMTFGVATDLPPLSAINIVMDTAKV